MEFEKSKTVCFSGYRPDKFDFELSGNAQYEKMMIVIVNAIMHTIQYGYDTFVIGGAPGFDILCSEVIPIAKQFAKQKIRMVCALPYENYRNSVHFCNDWKLRYDSMILKCDKVYNVSQEITCFKGCYEKRNYFMIDNSSLLICYYTGKTCDTGRAITYAKANNLKIINIANFVSIF